MAQADRRFMAHVIYYEKDNVKIVVRGSFYARENSLFLVYAYDDGSLFG